MMATIRLPSVLTCPPAYADLLVFVEPVNVWDRVCGLYRRVRRCLRHV